MESRANQDLPGRTFRDRWPEWAARLLRIWSKLVRTRVIGLERKERFPGACFAHWHGDELALLPVGGRLGVTILVSRSRDGESMARAARTLGFRVVRGSSSRGAVGGLLALMKAVRDGRHVVLAVDGPRGPRGVCKPGIVHVARKTGVPLFPVGVAVSRRFVFQRSWNRVYLPLPFARRVVFLGEPMHFPKEASEEEMRIFCRQVEEGLERAAAEAKEALANWR